MNTDRMLELNYEKSLCEELVSVNREIKELQERQKLLQSELKHLRPEGGKLYGIDMKEKERKGAVKMDLLCFNLGINEDQLDLYRGNPVRYWEFRNY